MTTTTRLSMRIPVILLLILSFTLSCLASTSASSTDHELSPARTRANAFAAHMAKHRIPHASADRDTVHAAQLFAALSDRLSQDASPPSEADQRLAHLLDIIAPWIYDELPQQWHTPQVARTIRLLLELFAEFDQDFKGKADHFQQFLTKHRKSYDKEELVTRFHIHNHTLKTIENHNSDPTQTYTLGENKFSDLELHEMKASFMGLTHSAAAPLSFPGKKPADPTSYDGHPSSAPFDWSDSRHNAVAPVQDQGQCGSCFAFSAISAIETACKLLLNSSTVPKFSEQQVVDCSPDATGTSWNGCNGCHGGLMTNVFSYFKTHDLIPSASLPYTASQGVCEACPNAESDPQPGVDCHVSDLTVLSAGDNADSALMERQLLIGTLSVGVCADHFQSYKHGVYTQSAPCAVDHGVVLVGYGVDERTKLPYWKIRNSWGSDWGEDGYIRVAQKSQDNVGVRRMVSQPIVVRITADTSDAGDGGDDAYDESFLNDGSCKTEL